MKNKELRANILLLITASIWGFAFVAQRVGMQYIGAFTFNGLRFALGALSLLPIIFIMDKKQGVGTNKEKENNEELKLTIKYGIIAGLVLFIAASLQQIGLIYTTAGKAGFITSLYIVLVPILGLFLKQKASLNIWMGVSLATIGLYFLSINENFTIQFGDLLQLIGALFWATHILTIGEFADKVDSLKLSLVQQITCSFLSLMVAFFIEDIEIRGIVNAGMAILYGGIMSVGVAYTLQIVGQKHAKPSHAAITMSMEAVVAAIGGIIILRESMPLRGYIGCLLMLAGMIVSQTNNLVSN